MPAFTMDQILDVLDRSHQRATYGAVAALIGASPRLLMHGRERDQRHSWVVSRKNGEPTGYQPDLIHPALHERSEVIRNKEDLASWLESTSTTMRQ